MDLERKLLAICNVAAMVQFAGQFEERGNVYYKAAEFMEVPQVVAAGDFGINAALVGRIAEGTVVCYRGTIAFDDTTRPESERVADWVNDFHADLVPAGGLPGLCHEGFVRALDSLDAQVEALVGDGARIYTGHSKGAALAALAALRFSSANHTPVRAVTFEGPRCGDSDFAAAYEKSAVSLTRFEAAGDLVPRVPFEPRAAMILASSFGVRLPAADYRSVGDLRFIHQNGAVDAPVGPIATFKVEAEAVLSVALRFASGGFAAVRNAHSIGIGSACAKAINLGEDKI